VQPVAVVEVAGLLQEADVVEAAEVEQSAKPV
jgi:hypothetical protein